MPPTEEEKRRVDLCIEWSLCIENRKTDPAYINGLYEELQKLLASTQVWLDFERQVQEVLAKEILRLRGVSKA